MKLWGHRVWSGPGRKHLNTHQDTIEATDVSFYFPGGKAAVLLIHGLTGTPNEMRSVGKGLAISGFTVYGMQLAGHCSSEEALIATRWQDWYASVEVAYQRLVPGHEALFVVGLCAGALLALQLAANHPDTIHGMALYATTFRYDGWALPRLHFLVPYVVQTPLTDFYRFVEVFPFGIKDERIRQRIVASMLAGNSTEAGNLGMTGRSLREFLHLVKVVKKRMAGVVVPALILHAREDDVASLGNARYVFRHLGGPVKMVLLDDSYHLITVDQQRHDVIRHTVDFFKGLTPPEIAGQLKPYQRAARSSIAMGAHQLVVTNSVTNILPEQWDRCFSGREESWAHFLALERANPPWISMRYLAISDGNRLMAAVPAFYGARSERGMLVRVVPRWFLRRVACLGSPETGQCRVGFAPEVAREHRPALLDLLIQEFISDAVAQGHRCLIIQKKSEDDSQLWDAVVTHRLRVTRLTDACWVLFSTFFLPLPSSFATWLTGTLHACADGGKSYE
ncbi:MAG: alpha/beta fold hydrolase [Magnetococcales bacterium]|nr:alpha/beta fold hydrolase [Magnetococcales bacterium]